MKIATQSLYFFLAAFSLYKIFQISIIKSLMISVVGTFLSGAIALFVLFQLSKTSLRQYDPSTFGSKIVVGLVGGVLTSLIFVLMIKLITRKRIMKNQMIDLFAVTTFLSLFFAILSRYVR